ncbi:MAG: hypothetical protein PHC51_12740, partial [bacterium]|nr:hypothetical protein [bacterium]
MKWFSAQGFRYERQIVVLLFAWFILRAFHFVFITPPGLGPDEMFHLLVVDLYRNAERIFPYSNSYTSWAFPHIDYLRFGPMTRAPYLYHLILGKLIVGLSESTFDFSVIKILRFVNVVMALVNVWVFRGVSAKMLNDSRARVLAFAIYTNLMMFTFLSSVVSYDNLTNLIAITTLYFLVGIFEEVTVRRILLILITILLGTLVKTSFLPFCLAVFIVMVLALYRSKGGNCRLTVSLTSVDRILVVIVSCLVVLNVEFYLSNIIFYGSISPSCSVIYNGDDCLGHYAYEKRRAAYHGEAIAFARDGLGSYAVKWVEYNIKTIFGIKGVVYLLPDSTVFFLLWLCASFSLALKYRKLNFGKQSILGIAVVYSLFLLLNVNYPYYLETGRIDFAINGRYLFVVHGIFVCLMSGAMVEVCPNRFKEAFVLTLVALFLKNEFRLHGKGDGAEFFSPPEQGFYRSL